MLTVYGCANTRSTRVVWALEEANADYQYVPVDVRAGAGNQPDYLALNAAGKVPTLVDSGFILTESAAICTYIADRFADAHLIPAVGTHERATCHQWCYFAMAELEQPLWTMAKHRFALPRVHRVPAILDTARWEFAGAVNILAASLGHRPFILGAQFSVADILIGHTLAWAHAWELPLKDEHVQAYAARLWERPALDRARRREQAESGLAN